METEERINQLREDVQKLKNSIRNIGSLVGEIIASMKEDYEWRLAKLNEKDAIANKVYIIVEDCGNDETLNVACFGTEKEAKDFCDKQNPTNSLGFTVQRFTYEEWNIGEINVNYE